MQTPDLGKRPELLRGMLLSPLMAGGPHDNDKPAMDDKDNEYKEFEAKQDCGRLPTFASATQRPTCQC